MYIELHSRSAFSFLEGASLPENLISACANLNMPAMALLDRNGVYGSPRFHMAAKKAKIKAHIGAEVTAFCGTSGPRSRHPERSEGSLYPSCQFRLPILVSSRIGYQNLCRLITKMKLRAAKKEEEGAVLEEEVQQHAAGLI